MRLFCANYAKTQNAYRSAIDAGYSEKYAKAHSGKMLERPEVVAEIKRIRARLTEQADKSATDVVNEFSKIAFTDRVDFLKEDPLMTGQWMYKAPDELTEQQRAVVEKVTYSIHELNTVNEHGDVVPVFRQEFNYIFADKTKALESMGRHFGIFDDKIKLQLQRQNPFANATPAQLEKLKKSFITTMNQPDAKSPALIEGKAEAKK